MFADLLVSQDADGQEVEESPVEEALVASRILELDGRSRSLVTLCGGEGHLAVGGDSAAGLVVYATPDNESFHQLTHGAPGDGQVTVVAGGQPGDYPAHHVVPADTAIVAATAYASRGELDDALSWEQT